MSATQNEKANLLGKSREELCAVAVSLGENAYRGAQLYHALYAEKQFNIAAMTNLSAVFRARLAEQSAIALPEIVRRYPSADGTIRYVLALEARAARCCGPQDNDRSGVYAGGVPADDLHFDAGWMRGGLPFLPDGDAGIDSQSYGGRNDRAGAGGAGR